MFSWPLITHALKAAIRDKMILALVLALAVSSSLSVFMGSVAVIEQDQFSIVFAASGIRLAVVFGLILFVVFYIRRSFDAKDIEFLLCRPLTRFQFLLSYALSFILLALIMTVAQGVCLYVLGANIFAEGQLLWLASIAAENIIMVGVALFFSMIMSSAATASMACLGFYTLTRMMGHILGVIDSDLAFPGSEILSYIMQAISIVMPRLDLMGQSSWLIYGVGEGIDLAFVFIQAAIFSIFIFLAAAIDLVRRQF
jgi:hypothetical protein